MISVSITLYKTPKAMLDKAVSSVLESKAVSALHLIDNWPEGVDPYPGMERVHYLKPGRNLGYGAAHNLAMLDKSKRSGYHLVMNPDVTFKPGTLEALESFMDSNPDIGLVMPKILNPDGSLQYQCKLLPTPFDLLLRRFLPKSAFKRQRELFELRGFGYDKQLDVPYLNGSFMFLRSSTVESLGGFDERIFMYGEDLDLSRRFYMKSRAVFFPGTSIVHEHQRSSYKSMRPLLYHCHGVACYFFKWGWFFDHDRSRINATVLEYLLPDKDKAGE